MARGNAADSGLLYEEEEEVFACYSSSSSSCTHTAAPVLGPRAAVTPGGGGEFRPLVDVCSTASCAAPTGRVPGIRGAFIIASTPCSCVLVLGDQHGGIVRLFEVV